LKSCGNVRNGRDSGREGKQDALGPVVLGSVLVLATPVGR
jgi:ribosomal protein S28E/S33